ncbi:MAG: hypothetical protein MZV70_52840 [Desulfobacterales bacterium]|nr:hypothetical protein [Desulfobacterales bacterium]
MDAQARSRPPIPTRPSGRPLSRGWPPGTEAEVAARVDAMYARTIARRSRRSGSSSSASSRLALAAVDDPFLKLAAGHGAGAQGHPRGEQGHGARRAPTSRWTSRRPSWR